MIARERLEAEDLADVGGDAEVGLAVARGGGVVDDDEAAPCEEVDEAGRRVHGQRRSRHHQQVGLRDGIHGAVHRAFVQGLLVQHDVGFDDAAAGGASRHAVVGLRAKGQQVVYRVGCAARHAEVAQHAAVQFEHVLAARFLMEAVDVLRHHGGQRARLLEFGQLAMRAVRLRVERSMRSQ